jgi:hypothetical protein
VHRGMAPTVVARPEVPADQRADDRCSCMRCGEMNHLSFRRRRV